MIQKYKFEYVCDDITITVECSAEDMDELMKSLRAFVTAVGFHPNTIKEYMGGECE